MPQEYGGSSPVPLGSWVLEEHIAAQYAHPQRQWTEYTDFSTPVSSSELPPPPDGVFDGEFEGAEGAESGAIDADVDAPVSL